MAWRKQGLEAVSSSFGKRQYYRFDTGQGAVNQVEAATKSSRGEVEAAGDIRRRDKFSKQQRK